MHLSKWILGEVQAYDRGLSDYTRDSDDNIDIKNGRTIIILGGDFDGER